MRRAVAFVTVVVASAMTLSACTGPSGPAGPGRSLPAPLYGVTIDDISNLSQVVTSLRRLPERPAIRVYFDVREPPDYYAAAIRRLRPVGYVMGELLDSSDEIGIGTAKFKERVRSYLRALGRKVDLWEIGNEVNGDWTGPYAIVSAKLTAAYKEIKAAGGRTALTLYYNVGCGDGAAELSPLAFSRRYVPPEVRNGLDYVFLSYYEDDCNDIRPGRAAWTSYFERLHALYPHARLGFGEIGMNAPATRSTIRQAKSLMRYYYGLSIGLPYFVGGYFWWYYAEDCVPYASRPLWSELRTAFESEARAH